MIDPCESDAGSGLAFNVDLKIATQTGFAPVAFKKSRADPAAAALAAITVVETSAHRRVRLLRDA